MPDPSKLLWYLTRGSGVVTFLLLTASILLGVVNVVRWRPASLPRFALQGIHRNISLLAVAFVGLHVTTTVVDGYAPIGWMDAVVPFRSPYHTLWLGAGSIALDMLLALVVTSLVRDRVGVPVWRFVHWVAYACWPTALIHSLGTGSDRSQRWMLGVLGASTLLVLAGLSWRLASQQRVGDTAVTRAQLPR